jgi:tRNA(fMet)-specific endonuclease VapC
VNATETLNEPPPVRYVLDTDTMSAHQRRHARVSARFASYPPGEVATNAVSLLEQMRGRLAVVNRARDDAALSRALEWLAATHEYFCNKRMLPFDESAARHYRSLVPLRLRIGTSDLRIAAIALASNAVLVTSNRRDLERVPGLRIEDWNAG